MRLFVDNLTNIDFSYLCPIRGLVGETWLAHIALDGILDEQGMVCDFGVVKKTLREWLDTHLDHCLLVPTSTSSVRSGRDGQAAHVTLTLEDGGTVAVEAPAQAIQLLAIPAITPDNVAKWCIDQLKDVFGNTVARLHMSFTPETIDGPYYHYSHGLKKHRGQCQRIAHGHRSRLFIWRNDQLCLASMQHWARRWQDIYIGTREDLMFEKNETMSFRYSAREGDFSLRLPKNRCYLIEQDSTVEHLAQHLADTVGRQFPGELIRVQAFEGIGKGAIAESRVLK